MQVKRMKRMFSRRVRCSAKSSFLNSRARPRALATAVATPSLRTSCMNRSCGSTCLSFHELRWKAVSFAIDLKPWSRCKAFRQKCGNVRGYGLACDQISHNLSGDRSQKDAVAEMPAGNKDAGDIGWTD